MFKIVMCEDGEVVAVPADWEKNNVLYWPPVSGRALEKLRSNADSKAQLDWDTENCSVRISHILSFRDAIQMEELFESMEEETTDDEENFETNQHSDMQHTYTTKNTKNKYHDMFNNIQNLDKEHNLGALETITTVNDIHDQIINIDHTYVEQFPENEGIEEQIKSLDSKVEAIKDYVIEEFAKINSKCDEIIRTLKLCNSDSRESCAGPTAELDLDLIILPMKTLQEVENIEIMLLEDNFRKTMIRKLINVGGSSGKADWSKIAFKLLYELFSHELLNCFSWTGIKKSIQIQEPKLPFFKYQKLIDLFYTVVKLADANYTKTSNETFLKNALRNAKLRFERQKKKDLRLDVTVLTEKQEFSKNK